MLCARASNHKSCHSNRHFSGANKNTTQSDSKSMGFARKKTANRVVPIQRRARGGLSHRFFCIAFLSALHARTQSFTSYILYIVLRPNVAITQLFTHSDQCRTLFLAAPRTRTTLSAWKLLCTHVFSTHTHSRLKQNIRHCVAAKGVARVCYHILRPTARQQGEVFTCLSRSLLFLLNICSLRTVKISYTAPRMRYI